MGSGSFTKEAYALYNCSMSSVDGRSYDNITGRVKGQTYISRHLHESLDPTKFSIRECVNTDEHPNTIPVILALDVTGSMGGACSETAAALGLIMTELYNKFKDIEFCIMGIGDLAYDNAPVQMSQFESDVRIAEALDKLYMERGGGGNAFESYTVAWYMGLHRTKLDCYDKQGRKGIIITMGDETLNPYLPVYELNKATNSNAQADVETEDLYEEASKKFDIFHITIDDPKCSSSYYIDRIRNTFGKILGDHLKTSSINNLSNTIVDCISESIDGGVKVNSSSPYINNVNENGEISW